MLLFLLSHKLLSGLIWLLILWSVGVQILLGVGMQHLLEEMERLPATGNPFLNRCSPCPEGTSPDSHVEDLLKGYRIWGCTPAAWKALSGQAIMLSVVLSGVGVCIGVARGETIGSLLPYYVFSMMGLYAYFAVAGAADAKGRMEKIKQRLSAYLEQKAREQDRPDAPDRGSVQALQSGSDCTLELVELLDELLL